MVLTVKQKGFLNFFQERGQDGWALEGDNVSLVLVGIVDRMLGP